MTKKSSNKSARKTVFTVIDLASNEKNQKNVAKYAAELAKSLNLDLILYPKRDGRTPVFNFRRAINAAKKISDLQVRVAKGKTNIYNLFSSIHDIAAKEHAAFIIMEIDKASALSLGETIWSTTQRTLIPTILLPQGASFVPYQNITIAADTERKLQKLKIVSKFAKIFNSKINVFVEHTQENSKEEFLVQNGLKFTEAYLTKANVSFIPIVARKKQNFPKRICKFSRLHSDLLVLEVDLGKIPSIVKQNIQVLLSIEDYAKPVMLIKTKMTGTYQRFN